jgi:tripartite-type tricarboxylate transporter receptor subunit TctC
VIENRPGASSNLAAEAVVRADPDGYTLLLISVGLAINTSLHQHRSFDLLRDIAPVASLVRVPLVMMVHPSVPAKTVPEFIAYARVRDEKLNYGSPGIGTSPHLSGELFKMLTGIDMLHVPYRGGPSASADLFSGRIPVMFDVVPSNLESIKAGRVRALAVTTASRIDVLPDVPTLGEFLPGYETSSWQGIGAPRNTSAAIVGKLNKNVNAALADPKIKARLADLGAATFASSPEEFRTFIADETEKWAGVVNKAGIRAD